MHVKLVISKKNMLAMDDVIRFDVYANGHFVGGTSISKPNLIMVRRYGSEYYLQFRNDATIYSIYVHEVVRE